MQLVWCILRVTVKQVAGLGQVADSSIHEMLIIHDLLDRPARTYNVEESGVPSNTRTHTIVWQNVREPKKV